MLKSFCVLRKCHFFFRWARKKNSKWFLVVGDRKNIYLQKSTKKVIFFAPNCLKSRPIFNLPCSRLTTFLWIPILDSHILKLLQDFKIRKYVSADYLKQLKIKPENWLFFVENWFDFQTWPSISVNYIFLDYLVSNKKN